MEAKEAFLRHIRKTGTSLGISIPLEIIKILNLKENEIVRVTIEKTGIGIKDLRLRKRIRRLLEKDDKK